MFKIVFGDIVHFIRKIAFILSAKPDQRKR